ncbi:hypothetical protein CAPTEDRAFT_216436 [Capitella teleta]|uniref:THAP-type domain-containing protein n=1 Tax=Capitella teleta TaxID=283909 RepID=R7TDW6_CAPTE|nr:hypothetical protein CAPTEDRAFT_216436 [Capitella teleta]|eukprot:ELT91909.1 hypothetical protein CAPTEDRAFT_216436 [Capitella teleta]
MTRKCAVNYWQLMHVIFVTSYLKATCILNDTFRFPKDKVERKKWLSAIRAAPDFEPSNHHYICSVHFASGDFTRSHHARYHLLKRHSVPSKFPWTYQPDSINEAYQIDHSYAAERCLPHFDHSYASSLENKLECHSRQIAEQTSGSDFGDSEVAHYQEKVDVGNSTKHDHTYATTPALLQHQLKTARQRIQHLEHEARNAKLREKRAKLTAQRTKAAEAHK